MDATKKPPPVDWQEKIHGFLKPEEDKPEHFAAIGRLVTAFNGIEVVLNWILRSLLGADTKVGRAIVGGMRANDMLAAIKRVAKATERSDEDLKKLDDLQQNIKAMKDIRDHAAHRIWAVAERQMAFTNHHLSRFEQSAEVDIYTIEELNDVARYAPYLSERALELFPDAIARIPGDKLPSREKPLPLRTHNQTQEKDPHRG
jgi:hypothetical protein